MEPSDGAPRFAATDTPDARATVRAGQVLGRSCVRVREGLARPSQVTTWIIRNKIKVRNVAGNREN